MNIANLFLLSIIVTQTLCGAVDLFGLSKEEKQCIDESYTIESHKFDELNLQFAGEQSFHIFREMCINATEEEIPKATDDILVCISNEEKKQDMIIFLNLTRIIVLNFCNINESQFRAIYNKTAESAGSFMIFKNIIKENCSQSIDAEVTQINLVDIICGNTDEHFQRCFESASFFDSEEVIWEILKTSIDCSESNSEVLNFVRKFDEIFDQIIQERWNVKGANLSSNDSNENKL